jgi:hypothetical protein
MTVNDLREQIKDMPGHLPVHVEVITDTMGAVDGGGTCTDYYYALDAVPSNFPTHGRMAVIRLNYEPR